MRKLAALFFGFMMVLVAGCSTTGTSVLDGFSLTKEPLIGKFIWHDLMTNQLDADKRFYAGLFGWQFEERNGPLGGRYTLAKSNGKYVAGLVAVDKREDGENVSRWVGYLSVPDVDAAVSSNMDAGGVTVLEPTDVSGIGRVAGIIDPQGAVLGLARSKVGNPDDSAATVAGRVIWNELLAKEAVAASEFYAQLAGYKIEQLQRRGGEYRMLKAGSIPRAGVLKNPLELPESIWLTHFLVSNVKAASAKVESLGGKVLIAPSPEIREGSIALITDPSGALLALKQLP